MKSFNDFLQSGSAQPPLDYLSPVTAYATLPGITVHCHRRMKTKTPYWMWSLYVDKGKLAVTDIDSGGQVNVANRMDVRSVLAALLRATPVTAICIPKGCGLSNLNVTGYKEHAAKNGDVWLVQSNVTDDAFGDYLRWDYGIQQ